jgi:hypothetical protein
VPIHKLIASTFTIYVKDTYNFLSSSHCTTVHCKTEGQTGKSSRILPKEWCAHFDIFLASEVTLKKEFSRLTCKSYFKSEKICHIDVGTDWDKAKIFFSKLNTLRK